MLTQKSRNFFDIAKLIRKKFESLKIKCKHKKENLKRNLVLIN